MRSHPVLFVAAVVAGVSILLPAAGSAQGVAGLSAPGQAYVDCSNATATHQRLGSGLDVQREAIRREQALLDALVEERQAGTAEAREKLKARAADEVKSQAEQALDNLLEARAALERGNTPVSDFLAWKKSVSKVQESVDALQKLQNSFAAGYRYATEIQERSHTVLEHLKEANKLFVDSGVAEAVGGKLAAACGPAGVAAFEGSLFLLDQLALDMGNWDRLLEEQRAADNLNRMKRALSDVEEKMANLVQDCPAEFGKTAPSQPTASTSLTPPLPDPPSAPPAQPEASAQKKKGGMSGGKAAGIVLGGAALAGAAVYAGSAMADIAALSAGSTVSNRFCIVSVMGHGCDCAGSVTGESGWTGTVAGSGEGCGAGVPCAANLSCNNGRCEGPSGRCPF